MSIFGLKIGRDAFIVPLALMSLGRIAAASAVRNTTSIVIPICAITPTSAIGMTRSAKLAESGNNHDNRSHPYRLRWPHRADLLYRQYILPFPACSTNQDLEDLIMALTTDFTGTYDYEREEAEHVASLLLEDLNSGYYTKDQFNAACKKELSHRGNVFKDDIDSMESFKKHFDAAISIGAKS